MSEEPNQAQTQPVKKNNSLEIGLAVLALVAVLSYAAVTTQNQSSQTAKTEDVMEKTATVEPTRKTGVSTALESAQSEGEFKNGTYESVGEYTVPGAKEQLGVTVTIEKDVVTQVEVEQMAKLPMSKKMQADFAANFKEQVVGKNIAEIKLVKISGSSLTPKGFNDALEKIKTQAQS